MKNGHRIFCLNSGSSSLKFALFRISGKREQLLARGAVERIGQQEGHLWMRDDDNKILAEMNARFPDFGEAIDRSFSLLYDLKLPEAEAAGHRLVHGGQTFTSPVRVNARVIDTLRDLVPFAPLHMPGGIMGIEALTDRFPELPQVACFDTAFHSSMPELARRLPLPRQLWDEGVKKYGFHGLSYESILDALGPSLPGRTIIAHLGNGVSMAALKNGVPLDTTMGLTPAGGCMMGTRSGDIDPGVLFYLLNEKGFDKAGAEHMLNYEAGLLGVSGISHDMKTLLAKRGDEPHAEEAIEMFCSNLCKQLGGLTALLGGLDLLVFTGGMGERAAPVRLNVCSRLNYLGISVDEKKNAVNAAIISTPGSSCKVMVVPAREDLMIARHTCSVVFG